ncbi:melibiose:sodium transporter MelB [Vallitalea okinawensis]|uniref:melibiose:sodium transporter MelB n=1 Tax=Vallitalea okinawensis TaxID=2078660 RepID=UPI000CFAF9E4|nr:melibiose:sodium transporter MelB [Vallitalea okinawensis]
MKLSVREKISYGIGAFGKDLVYSIVATYIMFYLNDILGINPLLLGTLFLGARIFDAVNDPMMGKIVDNTKSRFGKFRPWIFIGTLMNAVVLVGLFYGPSLEGTSLFVYVSIFYILWGVTYTIMDIPYWSMIPALTQDQKEREQIAAIPKIFASIGFTAVAVLGIPFFKWLGQGSDRVGFFRLAVIIAVVFIITISITVANVKDVSCVQSNNKITFKKMFEILVRNDQLLVVIITIVIYNVSTYITTTLGIYFFKYDIGNEMLFSIFAGIAGVGQVIAMGIFPFLTNKFTRKQVFLTGIASTILGYLILLITSNMGINSMTILFSSGFLIFLGFGFATILTTVMLADTVEYGEWKFDYRSESIIFSMQTFVVKLSSAISGFIVGVGLSLIKFVPDQPQTLETLVGLRFIMFVVPILGMLISLFVYLQFFKLDEKMYARIVMEIKERGEKEAV